MTDEEKKAVDKLKNGNKYTLVEIIRVFKKEGIENFIITRKEYLDIILNLIDNKIKELESDKEIKDKMIEMYIEHIYRSCDFDNRIKTKEQIKQYFENLAKESGEIDEDKSN